VRDVGRVYRVGRLVTDQFSSQAVLEGLRRRGVEVQVKPWDNTSKYEAFTRLKAALTTRAVELPSDDALCDELIGLEARATPSGATRIAASGQLHDDRATALAAAVHLLVGGAGQGELLMKHWQNERARRDGHLSVAGLPAGRAPAGLCTDCGGAGQYNCSIPGLSPKLLPCPTCRPADHEAARLPYEAAADPLRLSRASTFTPTGRIPASPPDEQISNLFAFRRSEGLCVACGQAPQSCGCAA
jgi:hypothetical protein